MKTCNACPAGLVCLSGTARFFLKTTTEIYVYADRGMNTHVHVDILLSKEELAQCWKVQTILAGKGLRDSVAMSRTMRDALRRRASRGEM